MPPKFEAIPSLSNSFLGTVTADDGFPSLSQSRNNYHQHENVLEVDVRNPRTHGASRSLFTDYEVVLQTNIPYFKPESTVRRRYSDFVSFREALEVGLADNANIFLPSLPPKVFTNRFSDELIQQRVKGLRNFLRHTVSHPLIQSSAMKILVSFLQDEHWDSEYYL